MNLKDRLEKYIKTDKTPNKDNEFIVNNMNTSDIFTNDKLLKDSLNELINTNKNIIFISKTPSDAPLIAHYLKSAINDNSAIFKEIEDVDTSSPKICIIPSMKINKIAKLFEYIICGQKTFILGLNMKNFDNTIEKIKALISVTFNNLTEKNINTLLSSSDFVFIYILRNEDGLYYVSEIKELNYTKEEFYFKTVYNTKEDLEEENKKEDILNIEPIIQLDKKEEDLKIEEEKQPEAESTTEPAVLNSPTEEININDEKEEIIESEINIESEKPEIKNETEEEKNIPDKKTNKYKLLKEKVKNKNK